jgi:hypothetical protein
MSRRAIERVTRYLADTREGLDRIVDESTKGKQVLSIDRQSGRLTGYTAKVKTLEQVWSPAN